MRRGTTRRLVLLTAALFLSCGGPGTPADGGTDGLDAMVAGTDGGMDAASCGRPEADCPCSREGDIVCEGSGPAGLVCRAGRWGAFVDDPCRPSLPDGSVAPDCASDPTAPSCPCSCDQERVCMPGSAVRHCLMGTWRYNPLPCSVGPTCSDAGA